jgi:hypothetical protein
MADSETYEGLAGREDMADSGTHEDLADRRAGRGTYKDAVRTWLTVAHTRMAVRPWLTVRHVRTWLTVEQLAVDHTRACLQLSRPVWPRNIRGHGWSLSSWLMGDRGTYEDLAGRENMADRGPGWPPGHGTHEDLAGG